MEVSANRSPLYTGGNRTRQPVRLEYMSSLNVDGPEKIRITFGAVRQQGGRSSIFRLLPTGVELSTGVSLELPRIRVRDFGPKSNPAPTTFLLSTDEAGMLRRNYDLTEAVMAGAYFRRARPEISDPAHVLPDWPSIVVPEWESAFCALVRDPAHNPVPLLNRFPWTSLISQELVLPCVWNKVPYPFGRAKGELSIVVAGGAARAIFARPGREAGPAAYLLRWANDRIVAEFQTPAPVQEPAVAPGTFDGRAFAALFEPGDKSLCFSLTAGDDRFYFNSVWQKSEERLDYHPASLQLFFSRKVALTPGAAYPFACFRRGQAIFVFCFADEAKEKMIGYGRYNFGWDHRLISKIVTLDPRGGPNILRGLLERNK
jgi:hypothetical protein